MDDIIHDTGDNPNDPNEQPQWQAVGTIERRILGVLVEKSKTTPDVYPMTINGIRTAANQKSNRKPLMQLSPDDIEDALISLRQVGAVAEIHGDGRSLKYKHKLYNWLGVEKVELAVMAELLLRGEQTLGDLRGRASRMEKIADVAELRPIVDDLIKKNLMVALTPPGRGQMVTHNLYLPEQMDKVKKQASVSSTSGGTESSGGEATTTHATSSGSSTGSNDLAQQVEQLEQQVQKLTAEIERINELLS